MTDTLEQTIDRLGRVSSFLGRDDIPAAHRIRLAIPTIDAALRDLDKLLNYEGPVPIGVLVERWFEEHEADRGKAAS